MQYSFSIQQVNDLSDIPEEHLELVRASLPQDRNNTLSREPNGSQAVFVYEVDGELKAKLYDRIKNIESYLQATEDNFQRSPHNYNGIYFGAKLVVARIATDHIYGYATWSLSDTKGRLKILSDGLLT